MNGKRDDRATLAQVLEDAEGCRALVAAMLQLDLPHDVRGELLACDGQLSSLIVAIHRHLGFDPEFDRRQQVA